MWKVRLRISRNWYEERVVTGGGEGGEDRTNCGIRPLSGEWVETEITRDVEGPSQNLSLPICHTVYIWVKATAQSIYANPYVLLQVQNMFLHTLLSQPRREGE